MAIDYFYSMERTGYLTVSDMFNDILLDMQGGPTATSSPPFEVINVSNSTSSYPYSVPVVQTAYRANVITRGSSLTVGTKLYVPTNLVPANFGTGSPKPHSYMIITKVIDASGRVQITGSGAVYELSDMINGTVGDTATDWPLFDSATTASIVGSTITLGTSADAGKTVTPTSPAVTVRIETSTNPSIFSFTVEATGKIDALNRTGSLVSNTPGDGQDDGAKNKQPWRIQFVIPDPQQAQASVATPLQMGFDEVAGRINIAKITDDAGAIVDNVGSLGAWQPGGVLDITDPKQGFINRKTRVADQTRTYPLSYILTLSSHGFFLGVWEGNWRTQRAGVTRKSNYFNWICVQRPVDRNTGKALITGKSPVFAVNGADYQYYKAIVREADVLHPSGGPTPTIGSGFMGIGYTKPHKIAGTQDTVSQVNSAFLTELEPGTTIWNMATGSQANKYVGTIKSVYDDKTAYLEDYPDDAGVNNSPKSGLDSSTPGNFRFLGPNQVPYRTLADRHSDENHMLFSSTNQVSLTEDKTYLITFPHNLTTPRFRYTEELDIFGTTSSDVVRTGQDIQFVTYGEWGPRTYRALPGSSKENTGVRIAVLRCPTGPVWVGLQTVDGDNGYIATGNPPTLDSTLFTSLIPADPTQRDATKLQWPSGWINVDAFPGTPLGGLAPGQDQLAVNLSVVTDSVNSAADCLLYGQGYDAGTGPSATGRLLSPIQLVAYPIVDPVDPTKSHHLNITYVVTRGLDALTSLGLQVDSATGLLGYTPGTTAIVAQSYSEDTFINFTVTVYNDVADGEYPSGQNSKDFYFLYKV